MRTHFTKLAVAAGLLALSVPATAAATPDTTPGKPDHPVLTGKAPAAKRALVAVQAAFDRGPGDPGSRVGGDAELTQQLLQLRLGLDELSPQDRRIAESYLARPTDGSEYYGANYAKGARPTNDCTKAPTPGSNVCVHWARESVDAPPKADSDDDGLPNQVEKTREMMNLVWERIIDSGGYEAPLEDKKGPDAKLDVYLVDIGNDRLYGYCGAENVGKARAWAAYCVLDDDYAKKQYPAHTPLGNLQVTAAHEFFHAVQFGYDVREDAWLMESTATWIEDEIFDEVNDNRFYLPASSLRSPQKPLDTSGGLYLYGNWIWWRYLTERFPADGSTGLPLLVRHVWETADDSGQDGTYSMDALRRVLSSPDYNHQQLGNVFADFSSANRFPVMTYSEGGAGKGYPKAPLSGTFQLTGAKRSISQKSRELAHMSSTTVAFVPKKGYAEDGWHLDIQVDLPDTGRMPYAQVTVVRLDGSIARDYIGLDPAGDGTFQAPFSSSVVRRVELTLTNGNHDYECGEGTRWSCHGTPDKARPYRFKATADQ